MITKLRKPYLPVFPIVLVLLLLGFLGYHLHSTTYRNNLFDPSYPSSITVIENPAPDDLPSMHTSDTLDNTESTNETPPDTEPSSKKFCDRQNSTNPGPCIFDIGLNTGQDTIQYLGSHPNSRVVAIEANPTLVKAAKEKFAKAIDADRLKLLNIGLVGNETDNKETRPKLEFWINTHHDKFSSFRQPTGCRDPRGTFLPEGNTTFCRKIEMDTMSCSELIREYGTPSYMKVDIEGMDKPCLVALGNIKENDRPKYVSKENVNRVDINLLTTLGYKKFKVVNQNILQVNVRGTELVGHSGPWGEDAQDLWIGKKWHTREEVLARLPLPSSIEVGCKKLKGWYDLHSKK